MEAVRKMNAVNAKPETMCDVSGNAQNEKCVIQEWIAYKIDV